MIPNEFNHPYQGVIESAALKEFMFLLYHSIKNGKDFPKPDSEIVKKARTEFFKELKTGELELHNLLRNLFTNPHFRDIAWVVDARCENNCQKDILPPLAQDLNAQTEDLLINRQTDEERTQGFFATCSTCEGQRLPYRSFFRYYNEGIRSKILCADLRIKESAAKATDKLFGIRPGRNDSIPNKVGEVVQDLFGIRAIGYDPKNPEGLWNVKDSEEGLNNLRNVIKVSRRLFDDLQVKNYYAEDKKKGNGYKAIHLIGRISPKISPLGRICEIQLRTEASDKNAENPRHPANSDSRIEAIKRERLDCERWHDTEKIISAVVSPKYKFIETGEQY